jgi:hypothetical protein
VTPNQHAPEQFVLLDNLYCSGEVSRTGSPDDVGVCHGVHAARLTWSYSAGNLVTGADLDQSTPHLGLARSA